MYKFEVNPNNDNYRERLINLYFHKNNKKYSYSSNYWLKSGQIIASILFFLAYIYKKNIANLIVGSIFLCSVVIQFFIGYLIKKLNRKDVIRNFSTETYTVEINNEGICFDYQNAKSNIKWEFFKYFEEYESDFLLYTIENDDSPIVLLLSYVVNEREQVKSLLYEKVANFTKMGF